MKIQMPRPRASGEVPPFANTQTVIEERPVVIGRATKRQTAINETCRTLQTRIKLKIKVAGIRQTSRVLRRQGLSFLACAARERRAVRRCRDCVAPAPKLRHRLRQKAAGLCLP